MISDAIIRETKENVSVCLYSPVKTSQEVNGVSLLHKKTVSQEMFAPIWKGYFPEENHVGYVTNGVHFPTWCATEWEKAFSKTILMRAFYS